MKLNRLFHYIIVAGLFLLLLTPLIITRSLFFPFITGKAFFFRTIIEVIFVCWLFLAWRYPIYRPKKTWLSLSLLGLVVVATLATVFSQIPYRSFWSNFERMDGLISYLHLLAYFFVISSMFRSEKIWQWFFHASIGVSLVIVGYSFAQLAGIVAISQGRLDATFGNAIYLAVYMIFHAFLTAFLMFKHWSKVWLRYIYGSVTLLQMYILYRTATRGAILGLLVGIFITALILLIKKWSEPKTRHVSLGVIIALVVIVGGFLALRHSDFVKNSPVLSRFADISPTETTTESRLTIWQMSFQGFREHPLLGWGPENYNVVFNKYYQPKLWRQEQWFDRSHNIFLDWLIDAGALGLAAYLAVFLAALYYLWRRSHETVVTKSLFTGLLAAYLVNNIFVFDNLTSYLLFLSILGYWYYHATADSPPIKLNRLENHTVAYLVPIIIIIALGAGLYYLNFRPLSANAKIIEAISPAPSTADPNAVAEKRLDLFKQIFAAGTFASREAAEQLFNQAMQIYNSSNVSNELKQQAVTLALDQMKREVTAAPTDARTNLLYGTALLNFGQVKEAVSVLTKAHEFSPNKQTIIFQLAAAEMENGDKKQALDLAAQAFHLDGRYPEARTFYALMLVYNNDLKMAGQVLTEGGLNPMPDERFINAYVSVKRYDLVLKAWQERVKQNPTDLQGHFSLAAAYLATGDRALAIKELQTVAALDPRVKDQADKLINDIRAGKNPLAP